MRLNEILFTMTILSLTNVFAGVTTTYKELCSYDPIYCQNLKGDGGKFKEPDQALMATLTKLRPAILKYAQTYNVDPRAIAGAILTENTINVSVTDQAEDFLVHMGAAKHGKFLGKDFSYGLGQLHCDVALEASRYAISKGLPGAAGDFCKSIGQETPKGYDETVRAVAMLLREYQDKYKAHGVDISRDPGILCTLYNLGKVDQKVAQIKPGYVPRVNYFGWFVNYRMNDINAIVGPPQTTAVAAPAPVEPMDSVLTVKADTAVEAAPEICGSAGTNRVPAVSGKSDKIKAGSAYEVVGRTVDCHMKAWSLIRVLPDGMVGWVSSATLAAGSSKARVKKLPECDESSESCVTNLLTQEKVNLVDRDPDEATALLQVSATNGTSSNGSRIKVTTDDYSSDCVRQRPDGMRKLTPDEIAQLKASFIEAQKSAPVASTYANARYGKSGFQTFEDLFYCGNNCYGVDSEIKAYLSNPGSLQNIPPNPLVYIGPSEPAGTSNPAPPTSSTGTGKGSYQTLVDKLYKCTSAFQDFYTPGTPEYDVKTTLGLITNDLTRSVPSSLRYNYSRMEKLNINIKGTPELVKVDAFCTKVISVYDDTAKKSGNSYTSFRTPEFKAKISDLVKTDGSGMDAPDDLTKLFPAAACNYDPNVTYNRLAFILQTACVERVYVEDAAVFSVLSAKFPNRVVYQPSTKGDRFKVEFKKTCTDLHIVPDAPAKPGKVRK